MPLKVAGVGRGGQGVTAKVRQTRLEAGKDKGKGEAMGALGILRVERGAMVDAKLGRFNREKHVHTVIVKDDIRGEEDRHLVRGNGLAILTACRVDVHFGGLIKGALGQVRYVKPVFNGIGGARLTNHIGDQVRETRHVIDKGLCGECKRLAQPVTLLVREHALARTGGITQALPAIGHGRCNEKVISLSHTTIH